MSEPRPDEEERERVAQAITARIDGEEGPPLEPIDDPDLQVPAKYRLEGIVGRGGFGIVYLARDTDLDRRVALKFLTDARPAEVARFRREARFAARLHHPAIVPIYELGECAGQFFIAMRYVQGGHLGNTPLQRRELIAALRGIAQGLGHAHQAGVVHRDIKPENILIDRERRAYLTDFGIARDLSGRGAGTDGFIVGTPYLMPPEQARGDTRHIDARSDVYALGATLYVKLTGQPPFLKPNLIETLYSVIHDDPPLPREHDATIPGLLEAIVLTCMQKDPRQRFQSMTEVVEAFDRYLSTAEPDPEASAAAETPTVPSQVSTIARAPAPPSHVSLGLEVAQQIAAWDTQRYRISRDITQTYPKLEALVERLDGVLAQHPDTAWARFYRGMALRRLGRVGEALEAMERSIDRVSDMASAHFEIGRLYLHLGVLEQQDPERALSFVSDEDHVTVTCGYLEQALIAFEEARRLEGDLPPWQARYAEAVRHLADGDRPACQFVCEAILEEDPDAEEVWKLRGDAIRLQGGDPTESYRKAIEIRRSYYEALHALAEALLARGEREEARQVLRRTLEVHPGFVPAMVLGARIDLEDAAGSEGALNEVLEHLRRSRQASPLDYELGLAHAEAQLEAGRSLREAAWLDQALATLEALRPLQGDSRRAELLRARALLERARHALASGHDPRPDLDAILEARQEGQGDEWAALVQAAFQERERLEGRG